jgi:hypothetical protein
MSSMSWMIAELADTISSWGQKSREGHTPQDALSCARYKGENPSVSAEVYESNGQQRTFSMDPKKMTLLGRLPIRERFAVEKPRRCPRVPQFADLVLVLPWIRWREPTSNLFCQFVTCHIISAFSLSNGDMGNDGRIDFFMSLAICCNSSSTPSDTEVPYCLQ